MIVDKIEFINAISYAIDFLEVGLHDDVTNHNRRVSVIALNIGKALGMTREELIDLYSYAMFHDNGITYRIYENLKYKGGSIENVKLHCEAGEENLKLFPFIEKRENIIRFHHENYDGTGFFGLKGEEIPLFSQIIHLCDSIELWFRGTGSKKRTTELVQENSGTEFSTALCDIFIKISERAAFWLSLGDMFVKDELLALVPPAEHDMNMENFLNIAKILSTIIDAKSPFTYNHSKGLAQKAEIMADYYGYDSLKRMKFVISAHLHDLGKLAVPNDILDKNGKLSPAEFDIIRSHTFYTRKILGGIAGIGDVCEWASNHHEKLNGKGYPYGLSSDELSEECQLMTCLDIYQALREERPYRQPATYKEVNEIFDKMIKNGEINPRITKDVVNVLSGTEEMAAAI